MLNWSRLIGVMNMELELEGLDDLIEELERIEQVSEDAKDEALIAGGDLLRDRIKAEVYSHGLTRRSGQAQEAIVRTDPVNGELFVGAQGGRKAPGYYLYMHEFGFYNVRAKRFIAPKPLVSVVYQASTGAILEKYAEIFRRRYGL